MLLANSPGEKQDVCTLLYAEGWGFLGEGQHGWEEVWRASGFFFFTVAGVLWDCGVSPGTRGAGKQKDEIEQRVVVGGWGAATKTCRDDPQTAAGTTADSNTATNQVFVPPVDLVRRKGAWPACGRGQSRGPTLDPFIVVLHTSSLLDDGDRATE